MRTRGEGGWTASRTSGRAPEAPLAATAVGESSLGVVSCWDHHTPEAVKTEMDETDFKKVASLWAWRLDVGD